MKPQDVQFKYTNNVAEVMRLELGGGEVLVIRGEPDMAAYEWVLVADGEGLVSLDGWQVRQRLDLGHGARRSARVRFAGLGGERAA